jgi:prolyl-tRNA editing enzyme YbaK/EbsC (Cys-tRNA(Pro) deacylase)
VRSCSDVHNLLAEEGVPHEIIQLPAQSRTALQAAELLGVELREVVKSLVFYADGEPVLALVPGDASCDTAALRAALGVSEVVLGKAPQVLQATGYRPGAVPPCALGAELPVVADPGVFGPEVVYCGGGTTTTMLKIRSADLQALVRPRLAPVAARG